MVSHDLHAGADEGYGDRQGQDLQPVTAPSTRRAGNDLAPLYPLPPGVGGLHWPMCDFPAIRLQ